MRPDLLAQDAAETSPLVEAIGLYMAFMLSLSVLGWWLAYRRMKTTGQLLPQQPRRPVPWGLGDILMIAFLWLAGQFAALFAASKIGGFAFGQASFSELSANQIAIQIAASSVVQCLLIPVMMGWLRLSSGARWSDLGLSREHLLGDLRLGGIAFVLITPPVLVLQSTMAHFYPEQHPFIEILQSKVTSPLLASIFVATVITAPWYEELLFRVSLQGWMERITTLGWEPRGTETNSGADLVSPNSGNPPANDFPTSETGQVAEPKPTRDDSLDSAARAYAPIVIASLLFGAAHLGHGPAPISLFFFALGLGFLYQRTHRLLPSVVVHTLLNAQTTLLLFVMTALGEPL